MTAKRFILLDRRRAFEAIVDQIREAIFSGRYGVGERLPPERDLATQFGVARHSVREAVRVLEHAGLVEIRRGARGGIFVAAPHSEVRGNFLNSLMTARGFSVEDLFRAKLLLEPAVAELVAARATVTDLTSLADVLEREDRSLRERDDAYSDFAGFHARLVSLLENPLLDEIVRALERVAQLLHGAAGPGVGVYRLAHREHVAIYAALRRRSAVAARAAMAEHLKAMETRYVSAIAISRRESESVTPARQRRRSRTA